MRTPMIVGTEWLVEAHNCNAKFLRDEQKFRRVFDAIIEDLALITLDDGFWYKFPGEAGITGLVALTESHLACHSYPEHKIATFNLYCCKSRPEWDWNENLRKMLGAESVSVTKIERGKGRNASVSLSVENASRIHKDFPDVKFGQITKRSRGKLPHSEKEDGIYFVTFRLADSLPKKVTDKLRIERDEILKVLDKTERELSQTEKIRIDKLFSNKIENYLDAGFGSCVLKENKIAEIVADSLKYFDGQRYDIFSWCVMPNHVHVVFRRRQKHKLEDILQSWKSHTAHEINKVLNQTGKIWQGEYYDHLVRNQEEFEKINKYVLNNPKKANLANWKWVGEKEKQSARHTLDSERDAGVTVVAVGGES